jgi:hypothetical protein
VTSYVRKHHARSIAHNRYATDAAEYPHHHPTRRFKAIENHVGWRRLMMERESFVPGAIYDLMPFWLADIRTA